MIKNLRNISAIAIGIVLASNSLAFASTKADTSNHKNISISSTIKKGCGKRIRFKVDVFEKLGITKEDIENGKKSGKTIFEIAKEKGHSEADVKNLMLEEKSRYIDEQVQRGTITKEKGEEAKVHFKEKIEKWDGKLKDDKCSKPLNTKHAYNIGNK